VSELRFVTVEAVRTGRATVTGKGKCREILLPGKLRARLKEYLKHSGRWPGQANVPVFLTAGGRPLDRSNLWREMRSLCVAAKVDPHKVFRITCGTCLPKLSMRSTRTLPSWPTCWATPASRPPASTSWRPARRTRGCWNGCTCCYKKGANNKISVLL